ncbi:MEDS domain-containing protein [Thermosediminibacter litoriperuensis]|uniref:Excisionase family DNA binding protein n=1 Tax=Thermosediminibacter litoriperuensis TaxID=291989 RepID=A0A5S5AYX9_9FIRM|nr:MEDS domain-containing protein [Thermosediminibacter litoriperuensis]TYP58549.1 excisionase family DNA binding protein [Thermosediminibacter litoriperuensis]
MNEELLTVEEVAKILRTTTNTIYRWLRAGKLPGIKLGKEWRIRKETLASKLNETNSTSIKGQRFLDKIGPHSDHVLAVTRKTHDLYNLEAEFFKKGLSRGYRLFKGCWWQKPDDARRELSIRGLPIEELEAKNALTIVDLTDYYNRSGKNGPVQVWSEEARKTFELGYKTMWGSGSPHLLSLGGHFRNLIEFESSLDDALRKLPVVGICPYIFDDFTGDYFEQLIDLMNLHSSVIFYNNGSATYLKNQPA